jgi:siroheme synthase-like protein
MREHAPGVAPGLAGEVPASPAVPEVDPPELGSKGFNTGYYPIFVNGRRLPCLVVGGGMVGVRKAESLLESGATVTVLSPQGSDRLADLERQNRLVWIRNHYEERFLQDMQLVIGATDDPDINEQVYIDANSRGILVNVADDPEHCTFIVPSVMTKGRLCVAVGTGGAAPMVAAKIRAELEAVLPEEYAAMIDELGALRPAIRRMPAGDKDRFWQSVCAIDISAFRGQPEVLRQRIRDELAGAD